jgi:hypothetical protein
MDDDFDRIVSLLNTVGWDEGAELPPARGIDLDRRSRVYTKDTFPRSYPNDCNIMTPLLRSRSVVVDRKKSSTNEFRTKDVGGLMENKDLQLLVQEQARLIQSLKEKLKEKVILTDIKYFITTSKYLFRTKNSLYGTHINAIPRNRSENHGRNIWRYIQLQYPVVMIHVHTMLSSYKKNWQTSKSGIND